MYKQENKKILITAFIGSKNLGDEAIFNSILNNIEYDKKYITALSFNQEKTQKFNINTLHAKSIKEIIYGIRSCDIMLVGGGGIIQDQSSILNFLYYTFQLYIAKLYRKPVILCFVGVGPIKFSITKWIMKRLVASVDYAIVRDENSKQLLLKYGVAKSRVYQAYDPVLNFSFKSKKLENLYSKERPYVVVSLRRWFFVNPFLPVFMTRTLNKYKPFRRMYDKFMTSLAASLDEYLSNHPNIKLVLVSFYDGEDDVVNAHLLDLMENKEQVVVAEKNMTELQYLSIVKNSLFIVGMRLHSLILGSIVTKPFVALRYSSKVDEFARMMSMGNLSLHVDEYNNKKLQKSLDVMTEKYSEHTALVKKNLKKYQEKNNHAFRLLNKKIKNLTE